MRTGEEAGVRSVGGIDLGVIDILLLDRMAATHGARLVGVSQRFWSNMWDFPEE